MARKRPSVIDTLDLDLDLDPRDRAGAETPADRPAVNVVALPGSDPALLTAKPKRSAVLHTSIYVPKAAYRKIREIANAEDRKPHDVLMEGLDLVLAKYGFPSLAEYKKSGKKV
jgi:hypothetical protein